MRVGLTGRDGPFAPTTIFIYAKRHNGAFIKKLSFSSTNIPLVVRINYREHFSVGASAIRNVNMR